MSYLLLIIEPVGQRALRSPEEGERVYASMVEFGNGLKKRGVLRAVESLKTGGARVATRDGKPSRVDGPFAEAKELIGGFFLIDCETQEQAIAIANECPAAQWATVEVRETGPCFMD